MKRALLLLALLTVAAAALSASARAQGNSTPAGGSASTHNTPSPNPVVMPPPQDAPPVPDAGSPAPAADTTPMSGSSVPATPAPSIGTPSPNSSALQNDDIYDIRPPFFFLHSWTWLWIALLALALLALIVGLWFWFKPLRAMRAKSAYELALEKLEKAKALLNEENPEPYAVAVSEAVRSYVSQRFQTPAARLTTEEFLRRMQHDSSTLLAPHRDLLREFLEACDLVKFAHYQPTREELEQVQQRAVTFVTATKPVEPGNATVPALTTAPSPALATTSGGRP